MGLVLLARPIFRLFGNVLIPCMGGSYKGFHPVLTVGAVALPVHRVRGRTCRKSWGAKQAISITDRKFAKSVIGLIAGIRMRRDSRDGRERANPEFVAV
jgi:hypothetical protein